jgi:hypothetical protein
MKKTLAFLLTICSGFINASEILVDDFSEFAPHAWYSSKDLTDNPGNMLGGNRHTEAFGGLTPSTGMGVQTGESWRDRGSNTSNSWGGSGQSQLNLSFQQGGYITENFLNVSAGIRVQAIIATDAGGSQKNTWTSPIYTLDSGAQSVRFALSSFTSQQANLPMNFSDIDFIKLWITQLVGIYPPAGSPAYVLDSVYATTAVSEPEPYTMMVLGLGIMGIIAFRKEQKTVV